MKTFKVKRGMVFEEVVITVEDLPKMVSVGPYLRLADACYERPSPLLSHADVIEIYEAELKRLKELHELLP